MVTPQHQIIINFIKKFFYFFWKNKTSPVPIEMQRFIPNRPHPLPFLN